MGASENTNRLPKSKRYTTVVFDLGDVLFTWSSSTPKSPLPGKILHSILRSVHWFEYEKGNISEDEAYSRVAKQFSVSAADVKAAFEAARDSLQSNPRMLDLIKELRESGLAVYAMSNISAPDWEVLSTKASPEQWALFDQVFTSSVFFRRLLIWHADADTNIAERALVSESPTSVFTSTSSRKPDWTPRAPYSSTTSSKTSSRLGHWDSMASSLTTRTK